ncbi:MULTISPECIES: AAA family ATPase [unclassified Pseudomonas]|uniref:AAA family ATPase n=1 Tax=unclassified Pseudomonas TaxID=196821 RepID=UPI0024573E20|nr:MULTISPECIES: AAA family ATPase [unclassified Pseudomonas]MDH4564536.1 chromosome segregation protein SMC [Pseudomonas sp. BN411]MDH4655325.1 chromosome segregation protein SMC [Pseudomonas sp. BN606]
MKNLKSITLSNIRRFGADTTIELSRGATILLAPNGTGKTAIFEAIEFGLTGKISRLDGNLSPIIRDSQIMARVSLDFGDVQASAQVSNIGVVERTGDLSPLFPETAPEDIPFLLRLTHLLDQREGEWLVKAEPKIAGSQLARLPIGKDGTQVSSALGGIRRALTEQLKQAKSALETLEAEFGEWQSLILDRDLAASQSQGALRSKENIAESISDIARQAQSFEQLPAGLLVPPLGQDGLETVHDALEQLVQAKLDRLRDQITALAEVDGLIGRFVSDQARSEQLGNDLIAVTQELTQKKQDRVLVAANHERLQQELVTAEGERDAIGQQLNRHVNETQAKEAVDQRKQVLETADKTLTSAESLASTLRSQHEGNEQLGVQHDHINRQRKALLQIDADLLTAHQLLERWEQTIQHVADVTGSISGEEAEEDVLQEQLRTAVSSRIAAEAEELAAKSHHETLTSAADSIRQAVASIAAHLPSDRGDCPLCGEEHGAIILHERVAKALEAIDPNVVDAERRVKKAADALRECSEAVTHAEAELRACKDRIVELEFQQAGLAADINDFRTNILLGGDTVPLAKESIRRREDANASAKLQLDEKQSNLAPPLAPNVFDQTKNAYDSAVRALDSARQGRSEASSRLEQATAALAAITADAPPAQTLEELSSAQNQNANQIADLSSKVTAEQSALDRQQVQLTDVTNRVSDLETQLSDAQSRLATARASWRQLSFAGDPTAEVASSREAQLQSTVTELARHSEKLRTIKIEIGAWSKLEQARLAQGLLDRRRGELSEDEFTANLRQRMEKERLSQKRLSLLSDAMDTLNQYLSSEIANVQKHVLAVVPRWQALLKRVVREQRFTGTNLDFRSLYRKERAEVSVPLHGELVPVPAIASEAQLTDLQLTFLLSMALDHQWSSWRGLLLDDPTQHHDLVHAASVFDVLRDYIVDHGFQVVIATHDALQARYFMRKLQNDGIEARLWSLTPTPDGVTASESPWPVRSQLAVNE